MGNYSNIIFEIEESYKKRNQCLQYILQYILHRMLPNYVPYLIVGDIKPISPNRIVQYLKLWKGLEKKLGTISNSEHINEYKLESINGIQYFGALKLKRPFDIYSIVNWLSYGINTSILLLDKNIPTDSFIKKGFTYPINTDDYYMSSVIHHNGIVLMNKGFFDDNYTQLIGYGKEQIIETWYKELK